VDQQALSRQRHPATPDQPHLGDDARRGATRARDDARGAGAGVDGYAVDAGGLEGFGEVTPGRIVVRGLANIDLSAPGRPKRG
jgi:hypothetical protein